MDTVRLRAYARGEVQGVGYRAYARRYARTLGIYGYARNMMDGSVEVIAEGRRPAIESFLEALKRGSPSGYVESVEVFWEEPTGEYSGFMIR
jgi:acylphosphatase